MKKASRLLIASLVATSAFVGSAAAQDAPADDTAVEPDPNAVPPDDAAVDPNAAPMTDPNAPAEGGRWPRTQILRPLTLPGGVFMGVVDIVNFTSSFFDPAILRVGVGYGITDDIELGFAGYSFFTSDVGKGSIDANLGYKLVRGGAGGKLEAVARLDVGYDLAGSVDLTTGETEGALNPLGLGVQVRYVVAPKVALFTPGSQLQIGLESPNPIAFTLPVGAGFQATPELFVSLETTLLNIGIKDAGDSAFIFADLLPITITASYNVMPALDVVAGIAFDAKADPIGDSFAILLGARYYGGKLN